MFYCEKCRELYDYPKSIGMSKGRCEFCGKHEICNNISSSKLPAPPKPEFVKHVSNMNYEVVIYPSEAGWDKIAGIKKKLYLHSDDKIAQWVEEHKTVDGGFKEQLWVIISDFHELFFNGTKYFENTKIEILIKNE